LPVPYLIVEHVDGINAESLGVIPPAPTVAWRDLGRDLAQLHLTSLPPPPGEPWPNETRDPHDLVELRVLDGWISPLEARRFHAWLDRLAPLTVGAVAPVFLHGDLQMSNVLLDHAASGYLALIDWGGARLGEPSGDFIFVPLGTHSAPSSPATGRSPSQSRSSPRHASCGVAFSFSWRYSHAAPNQARRGENGPSPG
jgi:aminoglycoside phosphotransferase (APT) family kinase protein